MQNVPVEAGVRKIRAVQRVFHSRTDVGIFDQIILHCKTAHNFQPRKFVHKGLNSVQSTQNLEFNIVKQTTHCVREIFQDHRCCIVYGVALVKITLLLNLSHKFETTNI